MARTSGPAGSKLFSVEVREGDSEQVVDHYTIRVHEGRFEVVEHGHSAPAVDWHVSVETLRGILAKPERYLDDPSRLPLEWLERRLGVAASPKRAAGWRIGRARRPS